MERPTEMMSGCPSVFCSTRQVMRCPLASLVGTMLYWLVTVTVPSLLITSEKLVLPFSVECHMISAGGFPLAEVQTATGTSASPSLVSRGTAVFWGLAGKARGEEGLKDYRRMLECPVGRGRRPLLKVQPELG